jgi:predicted acetyltransferase
MKLVVPALDYLGGYRDALQRGWSPDNVRLEAAACEELEKIAADPAAFVASLDDPEATAGPITLGDGSKVPRLPGYRRWMWDGEFCGSIGFRWQKGTSALPPYVLGHVGYAVVPWKRRLGYATRALALLLDDARREGLDHITLTTDPDNMPSQKVITANGGTLIERFTMDESHGRAEALRWCIPLNQVAAT